ncbi:MAG: long-chain fatty acid--CoA ligase [Acetobacteraceae bacterium]|nr:long-chain fatty acid--CoA ligase [Acetobacteraceae bacterium]
MRTHGRDGLNDALAGQAGGMVVGDMLCLQARLRPDHPAVEDAARQLSFAEFNARVNRLAHVLLGLEIGRGDRVAILSENRLEYLELLFAAGKIGAIVAALNCRLSDLELHHCIDLVTPKAILVAPGYAATIARLKVSTDAVIAIGEDYEERLTFASSVEPYVPVETEDGLMILYTSGTTGLPKGALISHRAQVARCFSACVDFDLVAGDNFVAWAPMYHMASAEQSISVLCLGGTVVVVPGYDVDRIIDAIARVPQWWLVLMPGMIADMISALHRRQPIVPAPIKLVGAMADLVPPHQIAEVTALLRTPYANTFGSTETGLPPFSAGRLVPGVVPKRFSKTPSRSCHFRLVDPDDNDVAEGEPGEVVVRGPTLFSGYWNAPETNTRDFRGGWFHLGDVCRRNGDGTVDFVDRVKYMIKSGGENIYPAEIERVLLADPRVADAVVVRRADAQWGEVPVAFIARRDGSVTAEDLLARCRAELAGYKRPKEIRFIRAEDLPRSTTGKIQRHEVEKWVLAGL